MEEELRTETGGVPVPKNFFVDNIKLDVFHGKIKENHQWEQFFWTEKTVSELIKGLNCVYEKKTCCLMTPSLAYRWHELGRDETLLDIDTRFSCLPKFQYYDIRSPTPIKDTFRLLIIDPPFFLIPVEEIKRAIDIITQKDYSTKIIIAWLLRAEKRLRTHLKAYNLVPTHFPLEYASIKPNKWKNFVLYSNIDLPGIKRKKE